MTATRSAASSEGGRRLRRQVCATGAVWLCMSCASSGPTLPRADEALDSPSIVFSAAAGRRVVEGSGALEDEPAVFGVAMTFGPVFAATHLDVGGRMSRSGSTGGAEIGEASLGLRWYVSEAEANWAPYLGLGIAALSATVDEPISGSRLDRAQGPYVRCGVEWIVTEHLVLGLDARALTFLELDVGGEQLRALYDLALVIGFRL